MPSPAKQNIFCRGIHTYHLQQKIFLLSTFPDFLWFFFWINLGIFGTNLWSGRGESIIFTGVSPIVKVIFHKLLFFITNVFFMLCWPSLLQKYWYHVIVHLFKGTSEKDMHLGVFSEFVLITVDSCNSKELIVVCSVFTDGKKNHFSRYRNTYRDLRFM